MQATVKESYDFGIELADDPLVIMEDDILSEAECEHIIRLARVDMKQATVSSDDMGVASAGRSGSNCWVPHTKTPVVRKAMERISDMVGIPLSNAESLQVIHYDEGQEYRPHFDAYDLNTERGVRCTQKGGQRLVTALLYLNTPDSGGGTAFPELGLEVPAIGGRMVLFHNTRPLTTYVHPLSKHGGLPVVTGEKWACNLWFREERYQTNAGGRPRTKGAAVGSGQGGANRKKSRKNQKQSRRKNR